MSSGFDRAIQNLVQIIKESDKNKTFALDTQAEVLRVEDGTAWVHLPGGVDETPVKLTMNAQVGDIVQVRIAGGRAWLTGNATNPPTDDKVANQAMEAAASVQQEVITVKEVVAENIKATNAKFEYVEADTAKIHNLEADEIYAGITYTNELIAENITAQDIVSDHAEIDDLDVNYAQIDAANINTAAIRSAWVDQMMVQTGLIAHEGTVYELDAIQVNASKIKTGTLDVERLIVSVPDSQDPTKIHKYMVHVDPSTGSPSYEKVDADVLEDLTITADKIVAEAITAEKITTENIVGSGGWINLRNGTFNYINASTGNGISWDGQHLNIKANTITMGSSQQTLEQILAGMQSEIDGAIETWYESQDPLPDATHPNQSNAPASSWTTTEQKNNHLRDLYFNTTNGHSYRWAQVGNAYYWVQIEDADAIKALADAAAAQETADNGLALAGVKRRVFVATPVPPYDVGDLWMQGANGDIMKCKTAKAKGASYAAADWEKASKYTDDSNVYTKSDFSITPAQIISKVSANETNIAKKANSADVYTKTETDSAIDQKAGEIDISVTQKISEIEVGGRNYVKDSQDIPLRDKATSNNDFYTLTVYHNDTAFEIGDVLTASANVEVLEGSASRIVFYLYGKSAETTGRNKSLTVATDIVNGKAVAQLTLNTNYGGNHNKDFNLLIYQGINGQTAGNRIKLTNVKLEKGNKVTDWSPAPEDVEAYTDSQVSAAKAEIKVTTDGISTEVAKKTDKSTIISTIRQSAETVKIKASQVEIDGTAIFNEISDDIDGVINAAVDDITIGGKNIFRKPYSTNQSWTGNGLTITYTADTQTYTITGTNTKTDAAWSLGGVYPQKSGIPIYLEHDQDYVLTVYGNMPSTIYAQINGRNTGGVEHRWAHQEGAGSTIFQLPSDANTQGLVQAAYFGVLPEARAINCTFQIKLEKGNKATDWSSAPEDIDEAISTAQSTANSANAEEQRIYYRTDSAGSLAKPTAWITNNSPTYNAGRAIGNSGWSRVVTPIASSTSPTKKYLYLYSAIQRKTVDGTITCSDVLLDGTTTVIDGGNIVTGTIAANKIDAASGTFNEANIPNLSADKIKANVISAINNGTGTINADKINATNLHVNAANIDGTISVGKLPNDVKNSNIHVGGRNCIFFSKGVNVTGLNSTAGSKKEYQYLNVGQSYMDIPHGTQVTISFDLYMTVNTANPTLLVYNTNRKGPKAFAAAVGTAGTESGVTLSFTKAAGSIINERVSVTGYINTRSTTELDYNNLEFYSAYGTSNWFSVSNIKLEVGNMATDWSPAPEDALTDGINLVPQTHMFNGTERTPPLNNKAYSRTITNGRGVCLCSTVDILKFLAPTTVSDGEWVTLSFSIRFDSGSNTSHRVRFYPYQTNGISIKEGRYLTDAEKKTTWVRVVHVTKVRNHGDNNTAYSLGAIYLYDDDGTNSFTVTNIKIERGVRATNWSAAPIDQGQTATTYITDISNTGIRIHPYNTENNSMLIDGTSMRIYKGGTTDAYCVAEYGSDVRIGKPTNQNTGNVYIDDDSVDIRKGSTVLSTFTASGASIGRNSTTAAIDLLANSLKISGRYETLISANDTFVAEMMNQSSSSIRYMDVGVKNGGYLRAADSGVALWCDGPADTNASYIDVSTQGEITLVSGGYSPSGDFKIGGSGIEYHTYDINNAKMGVSLSYYDESIGYESGTTIGAAESDSPYLHGLYSDSLVDWIIGLDGDSEKVFSPQIYTKTTSSGANVRVVTSGKGYLYRYVSSSRRYKEDIEELVNSELDAKRLYALRPVQFRYKDGYLEPDDPRCGKLVPGFIAEEVEEAYPIAAQYENEMVEDWEPKFIIPPMLKLIQEQNDRITELERRLS